MTAHPCAVLVVDCLTSAGRTRETGKLATPAPWSSGRLAARARCRHAALRPRGCRPCPEASGIPATELRHRAGRRRPSNHWG